MLTHAVLHDYVDSLLGKNGSVSLFGPEIVLCCTIVAMLLIVLVPAQRLPAVFRPRLLAMYGTLLALFVAFGQWNNEDLEQPLEMFQGMLVFDMFTVYMRLFLLSFTVLVILLTMMTGIPDREDSADFYTLLLGAVLGMHLMASANHLLIVFMAVEMASVPSYAMAGFLKGRRQSSEAALKFVVYGGAAAGVMLYGLTLLAGIFGTLHIPTMAHQMVYEFARGDGGFSPTLMMAFMLTVVGFAFKLSAFPFHFWCPDVFEGASAEVAGFLSVASKGAAIALLARLTLTLAGSFAGAEAIAPEDIWNAWGERLAHYLGPTLAIVAGLTATFGNLAAYGQTNVKRLLAYSTIAHAGYMMMALVPLSVAGAKAALFYLVGYLFMNLGAFAVVAFIRNRTGSEELDAYQGLFFRAPQTTVAMCIFLFSLVGIPPTVGFVGKFMIFAVLWEEKFYTLLVVGGINTVISLVYYVNVMRIMCIRGEPSEEPSIETMGMQFYGALMAICVLVLGIIPQKLILMSEKGSNALMRKGGAAVVARSEPAQPTQQPNREEGGD